MEIAINLVVVLLCYSRRRRTPRLFSIMGYALRNPPPPGSFSRPRFPLASRANLRGLPPSPSHVPVTLACRVSPARAVCIPTKVRWLYAKFQAGQGGILGDDMGLGKTVQSIALLASVLRKSGEWFGGFRGHCKAGGRTRRSGTYGTRREWRSSIIIFMFFTFLAGVRPGSGAAWMPGAKGHLRRVCVCVFFWEEGRHSACLPLLETKK